MKNLLEIIQGFKPCNDSELSDKEALLEFLSVNGERSLVRECPGGHLTTSVFLVNKERTKTLMCYHLVDRSWSWFGGHADGISDLKSVAIREVEEESGIKNIRILNDGNVAAITAIAIPGHVKRGKFVSSHVHYDVAYIAEVDEDVEFISKPDENAGIEWITFEDLPNKVTDLWKTENAYNKIIQRYFN